MMTPSCGRHDNNGKGEGTSRTTQHGKDHQQHRTKLLHMSQK